MRGRTHTLLMLKSQFYNKNKTKIVCVAHIFVSLLLRSKINIDNPIVRNEIFLGAELLFPWQMQTHAYTYSKSTLKLFGLFLISTL